MWPKFSSEKSDKSSTSSSIQLFLEPLASPEKSRAPPIRQKNRILKEKIEILAKLIIVFGAIAFFGAGLYYLIIHATHCARWSKISNENYASFYNRYVSPIIGEGEKDNSFYFTIYTDIYDGEYEIPDNFEDYRARFNRFLKKLGSQLIAKNGFRYNKSYTPVEEAYRFRIFVHNVIEFEKEESKTPWIDYDETQFTDWTDSELKKILINSGDMPAIEGTPRFEDKLFGEKESRPVGMDWRTSGKVTPVKNQLQCGSCWAFAVVASIESQHLIKKNSSVTLSEQQLVDCDTNNNGCHGGYRPYAMKYVMQNGLFRDNLYPYLATEGNQCKLLNETKVYINDYKMLSTSEETQADWIAQNGPVTFGMKVIKQMYNYRSGIFEPGREDCETQSLGSHAMTIIGYGTENGQDYWLVKNSWGSSWGDYGYFKLARGVNACGAAETVVAPIIN